MSKRVPTAGIQCSEIPPMALMDDTIKSLYRTKRRYSRGTRWKGSRHLALSAITS